MQLFYEHARDWTWADEPLRHAAGLVFCHYNAPIHRIKGLAQALAEMAKDQDRQENLFSYAVLESFDHIGRDLRDSLITRYGESNQHAFVLKADHIAKIAEGLSVLRDAFPRNKLHWIVQHLKDETAKAEQELQRVLNELDEIHRTTWNALSACFGDQTPALCYNMAELWDYIE